jgi:hypothetical protein
MALQEASCCARGAQDLEDGLYARQGPAWLWARSPAGLLAGPSEEVGMQLEPCSLSEFSTSTEADLCCGESFGRATPRAAEPAEDARAPAGACLPLACCGSEEAGHSEDDGVVQEMIRCDAQPACMLGLSACSAVPPMEPQDHAIECRAPAQEPVRDRGAAAP